MKDFAKSIVCNTKVGNGLKEDMKRAYPNDSIVDDVKTSATYEAIVKQPWRVYDILGVGDSMIREYAFQLIARKYGIDYDTIYYAWLHKGYSLKDYKSPSKEEQAKRDFQKLGVSVSNTKTGNSNKAEIIEKKKREGATLKVDNGQKLEFSDGSTYVKTSFSDDYREAHNHVGNAGLNLDAAAARDIREMAAKYWHSGIHNTRDLARTVAFEWAKKNKVIKDSNQDIVSEVKDIIDRSLNEIKVGDKKTGNSRVGNKKIKGSYVTIDTSTGRVTFDDFAGKSFDVSRIDSSAGYELRVMQQQINDFKKALEEAKSLAKQNGLI